jgi:hypothetical protein
LCRWTSCDPLLGPDGLNLYSFTRNNPLRFTDPEGGQTVDQAPTFQPAEQSPDSPASATTADPHTALPSNLTYSRSPAASEKAKLDTKLAQSGLNVRANNADYWRALVTELSGWDPSSPHWDSPDSTTGDLRFFLIKGGYEGFLPRSIAKGNADNAAWDGREGRTDLNDALVIFDREGTLKGVLALATPNYYPRTARLANDEWNGESVFTYWNNRYHYQALAVLDSEKIRQLDPSRRHGGYWVDIHHKVATLGCIEVAETPLNRTGDVDAMFQRLSRQFGKDATVTLMDYDARSGRANMFDTRQRFLGRMFLLNVAK